MAPVSQLVILVYGIMVCLVQRSGDDVYQWNSLGSKI